MNNKDFDFKRIAQGYKDRPFLHRQVIERFRKDVTDRTFANGLDVGCGAGLSAKALKQICDHVTGADISAEMIAVAREVCGHTQAYDFLVSKAEEIPAADRKYDIVTAAGTIQWVEREPFLKNLKNIMNEQGYVLIYDFCISDKMKDNNCDFGLAVGKSEKTEFNEAYFSWWHDTYLKEFPKPFRNEDVWINEDVEKYGFSMREQVQYEMEYEFDMKAFIPFMMIQSNVNAKIEGEGRSAGEVQRWFAQSLAPIFHNKKKTVIFTGYSWYIGFGGG